LSLYLLTKEIPIRTEGCKDVWQRAVIQGVKLNPSEAGKRREMAICDKKISSHLGTK